MSRINLFVDTHVQYAYLKSGIKVLADERDKKKFLDFVLRYWIMRRISCWGCRKRKTRKQKPFLEKWEIGTQTICGNSSFSKRGGGV